MYPCSSIPLTGQWNGDVETKAACLNSHREPMAYQRSKEGSHHPNLAFLPVNLSKWGCMDRQRCYRVSTVPPILVDPWSTGLLSEWVSASLYHSCYPGEWPAGIKRRCRKHQWRALDGQDFAKLAEQELFSRERRVLRIQRQSREVALN